MMTSENNGVVISANSSEQPVDDLVAKIAKRTVLVILIRHQFGGLRENKDETARINKFHGTIKEAKALTVGCKHPALDAIDNIMGKCYSEHVRLTMPAAGKMRIMINRNMIEHQEMVQQAKDDIENWKNIFLDAYPALRLAAPLEKGKLFNPKQWPEPSEIPRRISIECSYMECPVIGNWSLLMKEAAGAAIASIKDDLRKKIAHVFKTCSDAKRLHQSVFDNVREILRDIPALNISDDPELMAFADQCRQFANIEANVIADNPMKRNAIANAAQNILDAFGSDDD